MQIFHSHHDAIKTTYLYHIMTNKYLYENRINFLQGSEIF